jgi:hypothetical protein
MQKIAPATVRGRLIGLALLGAATLALAACGEDEMSAAGSAASFSSSTSASATNSGSITRTSSTGSSSSSSSSSSSGSTTTGSTGSGTTSTAKTVTLNWEAPTQNSNGSTLTNLAGYKIHYGTASKDYSQVVALNNPSLNSYVIESLASGTYYFAVTSYNSQGTESAMSGEVSTTVD